MWSFRGRNLNGEATSNQRNLPMVIENFSLVNKTNGTVGVNVYLIDYSTSDEICIAPYGGQLTYGQMYVDTTPRLLDINDQVRLATSGNIDYDFTINNITPP